MELDGCAIAASDGAIAQLKDFDFDDRHWIIHHLVVDFGNWLPGRMGLIAPRATGLLDDPNGM